MKSIGYAAVVGCVLLFGWATAQSQSPTADAKPSAAQGLSAAVDVTGNWRGVIGTPGGNSGEIFYELQQDGKKVTGKVWVPAWGGGTTNLQGTVEGGTLTYTTGRGGVAELAVTGDKMVGRGASGAPIQIERTK